MKKRLTNTVFIIGRVYADGTPEDYAEVNAAQKEFKLVPPLCGHRNHSRGHLFTRRIGSLRGIP